MIKTLQDLLVLLRHDQNGIPLEDIPKHLSPAVNFLRSLNLAHLQDEQVLKPDPQFFSNVDQLGPSQKFPLAVFEACEQGDAAKSFVTAGKARYVDNPYIGYLVVIN